MKKTFITFLSLLYILSVIGFGSVHHYCQNNQEMISRCESQCCSFEASTESLTGYQLPEKPDANFYCDMAVPTLATGDYATLLPGYCCEIQHIYNQLYSSSLPLNTDVSQVAYSSVELHYYYPQHLPTFSASVLMSPADPTIHVNLPLLI